MSVGEYGHEYEYGSSWKLRTILTVFTAVCRQQICSRRLLLQLVFDRSISCHGSQKVIICEDISVIWMPVFLKPLCALSTDATVV